MGSFGLGASKDRRDVYRRGHGGRRRWGQTEALLEGKLWGRLSGAQLPVGMGKGPGRHGTLPSLAYGRHSSLRSPLRILSVLHTHKTTSAIVALILGTASEKEH